MREKPAVVYPASVVDSVVVRADMESASPRRQSLQAAGVQLPEELSATCGVGASLGAMMGDQSLRKGGWVRKGSVDSSGGHRIGGAFDLLVQSRHDAGVGFSVAQRRVTDSGELVGQGAGGFVVIRSGLHVQRPTTQFVDLLARGARHAGGAQDGSCAVGEQHAQVAITALGNAAEPPRASGRVLFGRQAEPAGEVPGILEVGDTAAGGRNHRSRSQQTDTRNRQQGGTRRRLLCQHRQFAFQLIDAGFEQPDFLNKELHRITYQARDRRIRIGQDAAHLFKAVAAPSRNGNTELSAEAAQGINTRSARPHPKRTRAMQALQGLLLDRFDLHRDDVGTASRFQQGACVGSVGLVALDVGTYVGGRQKLDIDAERIELACPVMSRAARFHDDERDIAVEEPAFELAARQAMLFDDAPAGVGHSDLEHGFGQINGHGSSIHGGLLLSADPRPHVDQCAHRGAKRQGESIPSIERTSSSRMRRSEAAAHAQR
jgi:hypothetical protein